MNNQKPWYASRSVWGALIAIGASLGGSFGLIIGAEEQSILADAVLQITGGLGAVVALYGRLVATKTLK